MNSRIEQVPHMDVARNYLALSREFHESQLYRKAEDTLRVALEKLPNHPFLLARLCNLYIKLDMPEKALFISNLLIKHHSELPFPYYLRGKIHEIRDDLKKAMKDYERALTYTKKDLYVLSRLIHLLMQYNRIDDALDLIENYQETLNNPFLFKEMQASALMESGNIPSAFNKLRDVLVCDPNNKELLKHYLQLASQISKKTPRDIYELLKLSVPGLVNVSEEDLYEYETDYYRHRDQFEYALQKINAMLDMHSESFRWRKKRAFLKLEMGFFEDSVEELRTLFLQNSRDIEVRKALENYFIMQEQLDNWKHLVQQVLKMNSNQIELFNYMVRIGNDKSWLSICELDFESFMHQVEQTNIANSDITDVTFEKLPYYALEIFISQLAIHNKIPDPAELWDIIDAERQKKNQVPPFQIEDLEAAYPVWIFALHIYSLFKYYGEYPASFYPRKFQSDHVAVTLMIDETPVEIDITHMLNSESQWLKPMVKTNKGYRWRLPKLEEDPEIMLHEMRFYSAEQLKLIKSELYENLTTVQGVYV